jgi:pimeloyl-ACP methyl ester carboxylesterase
MSVTTINGQLVHFEAFGRGKPVVFVHGWLGSWRYWWPTMQAISNHHRSFAIDLWGFGDSSKKVGDYSLASHLAMLSGFIEKMGISRPFTIVGHSLGAIVGISYARQAPEAVNRIVTVALPLSQDHINGQLTGKSATAILDYSMNKFGGHPEVIMGLEKTDDGALDESVIQFGDLNPAGDLSQVQCPVLLVYGERDGLIIQPTSEMDQQPQGEANRHVVILEGCSHFPMLEKPAVFNRLIREFMNDIDYGSVAPKEYWQRRMR